MTDTPQRTFITVVNEKIVSASRYADHESTIPRAENWGWHVVEPRGVGLTPEERAEVERQIQDAEASRV